MIILDFKDRRPLYEQVIDRFKSLIYRNVLETHTQLPSVRSLAADLSINPNTIQRAYAELEKEGLIYSVKGKGSFVSDSLKAKERQSGEFYGRMDELFEEAVALGISKEGLKAHMDLYFEGKEEET